MKLTKCSWFIFLALVAASSLSAAEITGKVRDASGDAATIVIDGDAIPAVGDGDNIVRVEISTDHRQGSGSWATWSSLPIAGFGFDR